MANFVSYSNASVIVEAIGAKLKAINGAYVFRGTIPFASIPATLTRDMAGYVYNISDAFTTDARFIEGAGKKYSAGTNIAVADLSTDSYSAVTPIGTENPHNEGWYEEVSTGVYRLTADETVDSGKTYYEKTSTVDVKLDVVSDFVDVAGLEALTAAQFDATQAYEEGDVVIYSGVLYEFTSAHTANDPWDPTEVVATNVASLIDSAEPDPLTTEQVNTLLAMLD